MSVPTLFSPVTGPIFEILAGPERKSSIAHGHILATSQKLKATVQGSWKDSLERKIVLKDWYEGSVSRLLEWLYTGDYHSESLTYRNLSDNDKVEAEDPKISSAEAITRPLTPISYIESQKPPADKARQVLPTVSTANLADSFSLLDHVKLYALADYMLLHDLQALVFERLRHNLNSTELERLLSAPEVAAISSLVTLVQYVYGNIARTAERGRADAEARFFVYGP
ncbi:hypothetical protein OEA41_004271 [Lepraria neglecta]|uniref:BTB domain-containing protein n=1 Tax=Lepraria neglecta TaxID=209136 RepID=A0AAD9YXJ3_9LECA|nr:hypothetical protein OEA41_004271 [Lepraria neglecta]